MNILVFIPSKSYRGPIMELIDELDRMGHTITKWELALQWSQERSFPEKRLEIKKVWTHRLSELLAKQNFDLTISEAGTALESFQIINHGPKTESRMLAIPVRHCLLWLNSPCGWNGGRISELASQKILEADNLFHLACSPAICWELENILAAPADNIIDLPMPAKPAASEQEKTRDIVFLTKTPIPKEFGRLAAIAMEGDCRKAVDAAVFEMRKMFSGLCRTLLPSIQVEYADLYSYFLDDAAKAPFTDLSAFLAARSSDMQELLYYFQCQPEYFSQTLAIEEVLRIVLDILVARQLKRETNCVLSAPPTWAQAGLAADDNIAWPDAENFFASARVCATLPHKVSHTQLDQHTVRAMAAGAAVVCPASDPAAAFFSPDRELLTASGPEEMLSKAGNLLEDDDKRVRIMRSGIDSIQNRHTWNHCLSGMFKKWT